MVALTIVYGPYQKIFETRDEFEARFEKEFLKGVEWTAKMQPPDAAALERARSEQRNRQEALAAAAELVKQK